MNEQQALQTWEALKKAIGEIHKHNASQLSFEELYRSAYNLVLHKHGNLLYSGVAKVIHDHLALKAQLVVNGRRFCSMEEVPSLRFIKNDRSSIFWSPEGGVGRSVYVSLVLLRQSTEEHDLFSFC